MEINNRLRSLRQKLAEKEIEAILVSQPDNLYYLSGCEGLEGYLLITAEKALMVTDFRYIEQAERQSPDCEIFRISGKMAEWFPRLFSGSNVKRLGFESSHLSVASFEQMTEIVKNARISISLIPVDSLVESLRMVKDPEELRLIAEAAKLPDAALTHIDEILKPGMTEKGLAWEIEKYMRDNGSQPVPFELIVAAGPNSALPHAKPSDYMIQEGEPIVVDIGSKYRILRQRYDPHFFRSENRMRPSRRCIRPSWMPSLTAISNIKPGMTGMRRMPSPAR